MLESKHPRIKDLAHLDFIRQLGCVVCGGPAEAAHVRFASAKYGTHTGMGRKPDDCFTAPLCREHHTEQHRGSEAAFWHRLGIDPHAMALSLYRVSGDVVRGEKIIDAWRNRDG